MKIRYDPKVDTIAIDLAKGKYFRTRKVSETILVDEDARGKILGVEILDAKSTIPAFNPRRRTIQIQTSATPSSS